MVKVEVMEVSTKNTNPDIFQELRKLATGDENIGLIEKLSNIKYDEFLYRKNNKGELVDIDNGHILNSIISHAKNMIIGAISANYNVKPAIKSAFEMIEDTLYLLDNTVYLSQSIRKHPYFLRHRCDFNKYNDADIKYSTTIGEPIEDIIDQLGEKRAVGNLIWEAGRIFEPSFSIEDMILVRELAFLVRTYGKNKGLKLFRKFLDWAIVDSELQAVYRGVKLVDKALSITGIDPNSDSFDKLLEDMTKSYNGQFKFKYKDIKHRLDNRIFTSLDMEFISQLESGHRGIIDLMNLMSYSEMISIIDAMIAMDVDMHEFVINFPHIITEKYLKGGEVTENYRAELFNFIVEGSQVYLKEDFLQLLPFANYNLVRTGIGVKNLEEIKGYIQIVLYARSKKNFIVRSDSYLYGYTKTMDNDKNARIRYSNDMMDIGTIGSDTLCCFKINGLAESLVRVAGRSRNAMILTGREDKLKWFCFVWEILEYNEETDAFEVSLVLDNLEANQTVSSSYFKEILAWLAQFPYHKIYLGTSRNDIDSSCSPSEIIKTKPYNLIGYDSDFKKYSYDDSARLYVIDNKFDFDSIEDNIVTEEIKERYLKDRYLYITMITNSNTEVDWVTEYIKKTKEDRYRVIATHDYAKGVVYEIVVIDTENNNAIVFKHTKANRSSDILMVAERLI